MDRLRQQHFLIGIPVVWASIVILSLIIGASLGRFADQTVITAIVFTNFFGGGILLGGAFILALGRMSKKEWEEERGFVLGLASGGVLVVLGLSLMSVGGIRAREFRQTELAPGVTRVDSIGQYVVVEDDKGKQIVMTKSSLEFNFNARVKAVYQAANRLNSLRFEMTGTDFQVVGTTATFDSPLLPLPTLVIPPDPKKIALLYSRIGNRPVTEAAAYSIGKLVVKYLEKLGPVERLAVTKLTIEWDTPVDDLFEGTGAYLLYGKSIYLTLSVGPKPAPTPFELFPTERKVKTSEVL